MDTKELVLQNKLIDLLERNTEKETVRETKLQRAEKELIRALIYFGSPTQEHGFEAANLIIKRIEDYRLENKSYQRVIEAYEKGLNIGVLPTAEVLQIAFKNEDDLYNLMQPKYKTSVEFLENLRISIPNRDEYWEQDVNDVVTHYEIARVDNQISMIRSLIGEHCLAQDEVDMMLGAVKRLTDLRNHISSKDY